MPAFRCSLLDASRNPNVVLNGTQSQQLLIWTLLNNATGDAQDLAVTPFGSGTVSEGQYHFAFHFSPGALSAAPTVDGWDVIVDPADPDGRSPITTVYLALGGTDPLSIEPGGSLSSTWTYTRAIQEDRNNSQLSVTVTAGANVSLGGQSIEGQVFGPFYLRLLPAGTPTLSAAPIAVDFVGRPTVLNDRQTPNTFTFALTNLTSEPIPVTPEPEGDSGQETAPTSFTVWFDAAPNDPKRSYPWALAQVQHLKADTVQLSVPSGWGLAQPLLTTLKPPTTSQVLTTPEPSPTGESPTTSHPRRGSRRIAVPHVVTGNPQWTIKAAKPVNLRPQLPLLFTFSGIVTDLAPGVARMYLRYENLPGFTDGVLMAELEKSPLLYGAARGQGLYISSGTHRKGGTPPAPDFHSGLYVDQFNSHQPAATLSGGTGLLIHKALRVHGHSTLEGATTVGTPGGTVGLSVQGTLEVSGETNLGNVRSIGAASGYYFGNREAPTLVENPSSGESWAWYASGGNARLWSGTDKLVVTPGGNVGIGTQTPAQRLTLDSGNIRIPAAAGGTDGNLYFGGITDQGETGLRLFGPLADKTAPAGFIDVSTTDSNDGLRIRVDTANGGTERMRVTAGGNVGIGTTAPADRLDVGENLRILSGSNPVRFTAGWSSFPDNATNQAEISNDTGTYKTLMIVGNRSGAPGSAAGQGRRVGVWDILDVHGNLNVAGGLSVEGGDESFWVKHGGYYFYVGANRGGGDYVDIGAVHVADGAKNLIVNRLGGNVGIGMEPSENLDVAGNIRAHGKLVKVSDARAKTDVAQLTGLLDKLGKIRGVSFERSDSGNPAIRASQHREIGVLAQEVERVFPELVSEYGDEGYRAVDYFGLTGVLVEAAKELLARNDELRCRVEELERAQASLVG